MAVNGSVEWMIVTGAVWGVTNALMKRGTPPRLQEQMQRKRLSWVWRMLEDWLVLLCAWDYTLPFLVNLSASAVFFAKLGDSPLSLAVPVTNATTFAMTAVAGAVLGERMKVGMTVMGLLLIVIGIVLCISPSDLVSRSKLNN